MRRLLEDIPSIPEIPSLAPLNIGITTRVMAKRLAQNKKKIVELKKNRKEIDAIKHRRRSSKFLEGAAIPNSVIKAEINAVESQLERDAENKQEREEFVERLLKRLQPQKIMYNSINDENVDREALNKIKQELQKRTLLPPNSQKETEKSISFDSNNNKSIKDPWEELREKRRISRRTSVLAPLNGEKRPTYESIKKAIQNSKIIQQLLDADNIEQQKLKQIQANKSLSSGETSKENPSDKRRSPNRNPPKLAKKDSSKEKKAVKKRPSFKSEKSLSATANEKPVRQKSSSETKKFVRRSVNSKPLRDDLQKHSSSNVQSRRSTH